MSGKPKHYYISGPYTAKSESGMDWPRVAENIRAALVAGAEVAALGYLVHVPHAALPSDFSWHEAMVRCLEALSCCDGLILIPGWEASQGAVMERDVALGLGLPVYFLSEFIALHRPREVAACRP